MEEIILNDLATYYKVTNLSKSISRNKHNVMALEVGGKTVLGFPAAAIMISSSCSNKSEILDWSKSDISIIHQWLSFCSAELFHCSNIQDMEQCLKYINQELLTKPFLCGFVETVADIVLFYALIFFVKQWTYIQKELYINISRWFNSLKVNKMKMKGSNYNVAFSKTLLYDNLSELKMS